MNSGARISLDSNVLIYAVDPRDPVRRASAAQIIALAAVVDCVLVPQSIAEFFHVVTRKGVIAKQEAARQVGRWLGIFTLTAGPGGANLSLACSAAISGRFQFYDALLVATAAAAGCTAVISEDMHPGANLGGARLVAAFDPAGRIGAEALALLGG